MCGICGYLMPGRFDGPEAGEACVRAMADALAHRGPDDAGIWVDAERGLGLGHRRLAILDLSPMGHQPMHSADGRLTIVFNGEVYNHEALRRELADYPFRSTSDTETILAAVGRWGLSAAVSRFVGMFAFALWDREAGTLSLVRDRLGIKPLYYAEAGRGLIFGSELKALRAVPGVSLSIDRNSLALYFRHNYIPAPHSIYAGVRKVLPGEMIVIGGEGLRSTRYWNVDEVWRRGADAPFAGSDSEACDALEQLLRDAVEKRMLADVPLGAFLSGGIDSSVVAALMQAVSDKPVRTFSIGFAERDFNEADHARAVAEHLGTDHTELFVSPRELLDVVPEVPRFWDEPFADSSQIPTYILSRLTRRSVTVSLSGDGGDELFSGYARYGWTERAYRALRRVPGPVRSAVAGLGKGLPRRIFDLLGRNGQKFRWRLDALGLADFESLYRYFVSHFKDPAAFVLGAVEPETPASACRPMADRRAWMSLYDLLGYLPDDILTKVDRASMAVSLEARVPLLDHRVVEFAAALPTSLKVRGGQEKWLLRQVLYRHVPSELVDRPKMGFGVPIEQWMRKELRPWCEDLLDSSALRRQGYLDADAVSRIWREYLAGENNWNYYLWDVLMFQAWLGEWA